MTFSTVEREKIYNSLMESCEEEWCADGYKKTKIDSLCLKAGISKGSFYLFFDSKEDIFCEVLLKKQKELTTIIKEELGKHPEKGDLARALKRTFRLYVKLPFLSEIESPDFLSFIAKIPENRLNELVNNSEFNFKKIIRSTNLKYKIDERKGLLALSLLFRSLPKDGGALLFDPFETVDFMIDSLVKDIFF